MLKIEKILILTSNKIKLNQINKKLIILNKTKLFKTIKILNFH